MTTLIQESEPSEEKWKTAPRPNYRTNKDKLYPYSEVRYLGEYHLNKIPANPQDLIEHVDYWGEGRVHSALGFRGFTNCYNVNHPYNVVSVCINSDLGRKIPNRVPLVSYTNCDTSPYIRENSVKLVTLMGAPILVSCAVDIARIVNKDVGKVIVYGHHPLSYESTTLAKELQKKSIYQYTEYALPKTLEPVLFKEHVAYLNVNEIKSELIRHVTNGDLDGMIFLSKDLSRQDAGNIVGEVAQQLLNSNTKDDSNNLMLFGYMLWLNECEGLVRDYFPRAFELMYSEGRVKIINKKYNYGLNTAKDNSGLVLGNILATNAMVRNWKFKPKMVEEKLFFILYHLIHDRYLTSDTHSEDSGDRKTFVTQGSFSDRQMFKLVPLIKNGDLIFYIVNVKYNQGLKLDVVEDKDNNRVLYGHNGNITSSNDETAFQWIVSDRLGAAAADTVADEIKFDTVAKTDTVAGETKNDTLASNSKADTVAAVTKPDTVGGEANANTVAAKTKPDTLGGETNPNTAAAETKPDTVGGETNANTVAAETKPDTVDSTTNSDTVAAEAKAVTVAAETKPDTVGGETNANTVAAETKPDTVAGETNADTIAAEAKSYGCPCDKNV